MKLHDNVRNQARKQYRKTILRILHRNIDFRRQKNDVILNIGNFKIYPFGQI